MSEETITVALSKPITIPVVNADGKKTDETREVKELTFREPEVGDLITSESVSSGAMGQTVATLAAMAGVPLPAFRKIKARDLNKIISATAGLLGNDQAEDGETSPSS